MVVHKLLLILINDKSIEIAITIKLSKYIHNTKLVVCDIYNIKWGNIKK